MVALEPWQCDRLKNLYEIVDIQTLGEKKYHFTFLGLWHSYEHTQFVSSCYFYVILQKKHDSECC